MSAQPDLLVEVTGASKSFGAVRALRGVDLTVRPGEVHGLVGANGAGKSTLIRILAGLQQPDEGEIVVSGAPETIRTTADARALGFTFIHQELSLIPKFSVLQNLALGNEEDTLGFTNARKIREKASAVMTRLALDFSLDAKVSDLSVPDRWLVSIGRALMNDARLIVMDEPSASLSAQEADRLFRIVRELSASGVAVLYVSHRLDEVVDLCDRVTVFKDGANVITLERGDYAKNDLVEHIVGRAIETLVHDEREHDSAEPVLEVRNLRQLPAVRDMSLTVHKGEILGIAGLVGAGRTELAKVIFGVTQPDSGEMLLEGTPHRPRAAVDSIRRGIALVPEERRSEGLLLDKSIAFNLNLPSLPSLHVSSWLPLLDMRKSQRRAREIAERFRVKLHSVDARVNTLSGGNQQKIVMGKWFADGPVQLLILDEPSKGVDVGARSEIYRIIREFADEGMGVLVISSEFEELTACDRVVVMVEGENVGELRGTAINEQTLLSMCYTKGETA